MLTLDRRMETNRELFHTPKRPLFVPQYRQRGPPQHHQPKHHSSADGGLKHGRFHNPPNQKWPKNTYQNRDFSPKKQRTDSSSSNPSVPSILSKLFTAPPSPMNQQNSLPIQSTPPKTQDFKHHQQVPGVKISPNELIRILAGGTPPPPPPHHQQQSPQPQFFQQPTIHHAKSAPSLKNRQIINNINNNPQKSKPIPYTNNPYHQKINNRPRTRPIPITWATTGSGTTPPTISQCYAGAKFAESPSAKDLPPPPLQWVLDSMIQNSREDEESPMETDTVGSMTNTKG